MGTALGDLYIGNSTGSHNAHLKFGQGIENAPYLMHLYSLFESYCGTPPNSRGCVAFVLYFFSVCVFFI